MSLRNYLPPIHTSPESAYLIADFPFGFKLRCQKRIWIESNNKGQRVCSQTTDPRRPGESWNKPKMGTYSEISVLYLDEDEHVQIDGLNIYSNQEAIETFIQRAAAALGEREKKSLELMQKAAKIYNAVINRPSQSQTQAETP